ncbi:MAG: hypothetical protein K6E27_14175 [Eubacterium sp.]|nr:hypothetical protein [Eubacterium sp.]
MAIDNTAVIDAVAYEESKLILQLYDHLEFTEDIEKDHMFMLQEKLNSYIWYVDTKQYEETYADVNFDLFEIQIKFKYQPSDFCIEYLNHANNKLQALNIKIVYECTE